MVRLVLISDTHNRHGDLELPAGDVLVHAGDATGRGTLPECAAFLAWLGAQPHPHKVLIAGNHDFLAEREPQRFRALVPPGVVYLEDESAAVAGLTFWGSPITPWFFDWAFNRQRGAEIAVHWARIPQGCDVLVTHGPPYGILDRTTRGDYAGCEELRRRVDVVAPKLHVFGHIHEARGVLQQGGTTFVNACVLDAEYRLASEPVVVDL